jgi:subtilisin family serine protease
MYRDSGSSRKVLAVTAAMAMAATLSATLGTGTASAKPEPPLTKGAHVSAAKALAGAAGHRGTGAASRPAGLPHKGNYAFLVKLSTKSTATAYAQKRGAGRAQARAAAKVHLSSITQGQNAVIGRLPKGSRVLYRTHAALAGIGVVTNVDNYEALRNLKGVQAVYPIAPKKPSNSYAVPLQGAPQVWTAYGDLGADSTVAIIDTGVDYTHADLGGQGTVAAFKEAAADQGRDDADFPGSKVIGGYDLAGDSYNADPNSADYNPTPSPDPYPLDCNGHGSHVAGTVAGYGENADGSTYTGAYDKSTPFDTMKIGPGMAPKAKLYAFRVFGCDGSTDLVSAAIDKALDPNGDGDTSDHVDVANLSLGSDYGSPQDGDSIAVEAAVKAGVQMVIASGNAGDLYDVGGSPGDASSALTAAASTDSYAELDALNLSSPSSSYGAERSVAYDWADDPDLSGEVARVSDPTNLDGCDPLSAADAAAVAGKIAFVEWTDTDADRRCGSVARSANLAAAGASGFIFADDSESFAAGITGSDTIPGVMVTKTGGDAIRAALMANTPVTVAGTTAAGFRQILPGRDDMVTGFSSRGIGDTGNVKPDIAAVGESVFSIGSGTGDAGASESGTSMATPMVAGAAALVHSAHPDWTPEQSKADLMNTAGQDLFTGTGHTGTKYAPQRVGSGRLDVKAALDNGVLAYNADDPGAVSASFGQIETSQPVTLAKTIKVENTTTSAADYDISYDARTTAPGAEVSVSPSSVSLDPRSSKTVTVTLTVDPARLTKTHDPTVDLTQGGIPRVFQSDVSGLVLLTSTGRSPQLRVPVYAAPRAASTMTQPAKITLPRGPVQSALLPLRGSQVNSGSGDTRVQSLVAGFELQAVDGRAPTCTDTVSTHCVSFEDQRAADLKYVGTTSDAPQLLANGQDPLSDGMAYFAVSTQGAWRTAAGMQEFDIYIDGDGDGNADAVLFNTRLPDTDVLVSELFDLHTGKVTDVEPLNAALGDTDTALLNSDTMVLPVAISAIPGVVAGHSRISYGIASYTAYSSSPVDTIGMNDDGDLVDPLSTDVVHPGLSLAGSYTGESSPLLFPDSPASVLKLTRDPASYAVDDAEGALVVHFQNAVGDKAQVVNLTAPAAVGLKLAPTKVTRGQQVAATVTIPRDAGPGATGAVTLSAGGTRLASGMVRNGTATLRFSPTSAGSLPVVASYAGDANYDPATSSPVTLTVSKTRPTIKLSVTPKTFRHGKTATATVSVRQVAGIAATGTVKLMAGKAVLGTGKVVAGTAKVRFTSRKAKLSVVAKYAGDGNYLAGRSNAVRIRVR